LSRKHQNIMPTPPRKLPKRPTISDEEALQFHQRGKPGKLEINPTKPMATQRDLSLAYSPGVAVPVQGDRRGSPARPMTIPPRAIWWP
jgi:malic enzyme